MNLKLSQKVKQMASALLVTMVLGGILCMFVVYYLSLIQQQNTLSVRSQAWNLAIAVTEAGVEEGLQAINNNGGNLLSTEWTFDGTYYCRSNNMLNGNSYEVWIKGPTALFPEITSRSYINLPAMAAARSLTMFAAMGLDTSGSTTVSRAVRVTCSKNPTTLFTAAMVSKHAINLNGNGVAADSFDSSNPAKSTNGKYDPNKYTGDFGDVATIDSVIVGVQNANIYGKLHTGPTGGYSMGSQGGVGTHAWQAANGGGMQPGYFLQDANFTFPDTTLPDTSSGYLTPQPGDIVVTTHPVASNLTTTATCPAPLPFGGVTTNFISYTTVSTYPSPVPPGLSTNTTWHNYSATMPSPIPAGSSTNTVMAYNSPTLPSPVPAGTSTNTTPTSSKTYPSAGTFLGSVATRIVSTGNPSGRGTWYDYNQISSYNYPTYTYNYPTYTYTYPTTFTYTYDLYATNTIVTTNHYDNVLLANTKYISSALTGQTIVIGANVTLVLPKGLTGAENLFFQYADNYNPGLTIYAGGTSASISGNQYINPSGFAGSLLIYCAPSVTSFTLNGNGQFTGVLVAPNANLAMHGGGNSDEDFCGSLMVNSASLNGHFKFHWDESLGHMYSVNNARYLVKSWDEIP
jgi:hypothetical protein